jgi:glycolate oxidase iron-sulfur subunit
MSVCPVYDQVHREGFVARGKLQLFSAHENGCIPTSEAYSSFLSACLLCGRCLKSCPNEVDTPLVIQAARAALSKQNRTGWVKRLALRRLLPAPHLLSLLLKSARGCEVLWAARVPHHSGLYIRFLSGPSGERHTIPSIADRFFLDRDLLPPVVTGHPKVALFVGCVSNYLRPQAAEAALRVLERTGAAVIVPKGQACCGLPAYSAGENETALSLAKRNLDALVPDVEAAPDFITTTCASCAWMLKEHLARLLEGDPQLQKRARLLAERVIPFSRLWATLRGISVEGPGRVTRRSAVQPEKTLLTFHDPCHLLQGFNEKEAPRYLLTHLQRAEFIEHDDPCSCCGHGGSFSVSHYDLSVGIARKKVERIRRSDADMVVTECSGCLLQLSEALVRENPIREVITTAEAADCFGE